MNRDAPSSSLLSWARSELSLVQPPSTRWREIFVVTKSFLQSAGLQPVLSVYANQHFHLKVLHLLQLMQDPDIGLIDIAESGFHTGVFEPIRFSGIWRYQATEFRIQSKKTRTPCLV